MRAKAWEVWDIGSPVDGSRMFMAIDPDNPEDGAFLLRHIRYLLERRSPGNTVPVQIHNITGEAPS